VCSLRDSDDLLPLHLQFIHSVLDDTVGDLLDMISAEERRQEAQERDGEFTRVA
jgi:hypothetical protein